MINILSLDGGGTWALLEARALAALYPGEGGHRILSRFDYAFANSGGSIVLGGLLKDMTPAEIERQFTDPNLRATLYQTSPLALDWILRRFGAGAKYSTPAKQKALNDIFGTLPLASLQHDNGRLTKVVIVAFDYIRSRAFFFRSPGTVRFPTVHEMTVASAIHASTTAPVLYYDRPAQFLVDLRYPGFTGVPINMQFWDGGVTGLNNPVAAAVAEAMSAGAPADSIAVLSIGTGSVLRSNNCSQTGDPAQLSPLREKLDPIADIKKLAEAVADDPPDFASFLAHTATGGIALLASQTTRDTRIVRMSPLVLGDFDRQWRRPAWNTPPVTRGGLDLFERLQQLGMDAVAQQDVEDIGALGTAWLTDRARNQPIRGNFFQEPDAGYHAEIGHVTFSAARAAAAGLGLL